MKAQTASWPALFQFLPSLLLACVLPTAQISAEARPGNEIRLHGGEYTSNGAFRFFFGANSGSSYHIETSSDLTHWISLTNVVGTGGNLWIEDQQARTFPQRFYHIGIRPTLVTNMIFIPPGTFTMGSPQSEPARNANEGPQTTVTLTRGFWIGKFEVIQSDYVALIGVNQSTTDGDRRLPINFANWNHATNFCHKLTERERSAGRIPAGHLYRLPTEAEWEYACRAGTTTPVAIGDGTSLGSTQANFDGTLPYGGAEVGPSRRALTLPGTFAPNAWGLYDMHGNVTEWCQDYFAPHAGGNLTNPKGPATGTIRVMRGGGYGSAGAGCRSAKRDGRSPTLVNVPQGFRVVLAAE